MRFMLVVLATTALISPVMAQQQQNRPETAPQTAPSISQGSPASPSPSDRRDQIRSEIRERIVQRIDQRLSEFKDTLRLTPEQEARWPAFESGIRSFLTLRAQQFSAMRDSGPSTPADRLRRRAENLAAISGGLERLADAEEALYTTLSDAQKDQFRDFVWLVRRTGTDVEGRDSGEGDRFQDRDRWSYRHRHWRHHMCDEDDDDWRDRSQMMRRHYMRDEDDRDRHGHHARRDRDRRSMCHCREDRMRDRWRDEHDRSWMDDD